MTDKQPEPDYYLIHRSELVRIEEFVNTYMKEIAKSVRSRPYSPAPVVKTCPHQMLHVLCGESDHSGSERFNACKYRCSSDWLDGCSLPYPSNQHDKAIRQSERENTIRLLENRKLLSQTIYHNFNKEMQELSKVRIEEIEGIIESLRAKKGEPDCPVKEDKKK